eukprot:scaffold357_cov239-Pinguiococcus_pyrenoidosus.AAC.7
MELCADCNKRRRRGVQRLNSWSWEKRNVVVEECLAILRHSYVCEYQLNAPVLQRQRISTAGFVDLLGRHRNRSIYSISLTACFIVLSFMRAALARPQEDVARP